MEMDGYISGSYVWRWSAGFYTLSGSKATLTMVGEDSGIIDVQLSGDTLVTSGSDFDDDGYWYEFVYTWKKNKSYYTQEQLDQAVAAASNTVGSPNQTLSLIAGWNLVGLTGENGKQLMDIISGQEGSIASVWKWDNGKWAVCLPGQDDGGTEYAGSKGFSVLENINPGEGFWVNCTEDIILD